MSRDVLLKIIDADQLPKTVAGMRVNAVTINGRRFRVNDLSADTKIFDNMKSLEVSGTGVFLNAACEGRAVEAFFGIQTLNLKIIIPDFAYIDAPFLISHYGHGRHSVGDPTFAMTLKSSGDIKFGAI